MDDMSLLFAFPDESASFVNGFEAGALWRRMEGGEVEIDCGFKAGLPIHTANVELIRRMAKVANYAIEARATEFEEWTGLRLKAGGRPVLRLVQG